MPWEEGSTWERTDKTRSGVNVRSSTIGFRGKSRFPRKRQEWALEVELNKCVFRLSAVTGYQRDDASLQPQDLPRVCQRADMTKPEVHHSWSKCCGASPYPGDDELPGVLVVGVNSLS